MSHELPFATLGDGVWKVPAQLKEIEPSLPAGGRAYTAIFLSSRIGALGWVGAGKKGVKGTKPKFRFVLPHPRANVVVAPLIPRVQAVCRRVQFTKNHEKVKFDQVGRLVSEVEILVWVAEPIPTFAILSVPGFKSVEYTSAVLGKAEIELKLTGKPCSFSLKELPQNNKRVSDEHKAALAVNPNAPAPSNETWNEFGVDVALDSGTYGVRLNGLWREALTRDPKAVATVVQKFMTAADFSGLSVPEVDQLLVQYDLIS
jgi:hypothetical protein